MIQREPKNPNPQERPPYNYVEGDSNVRAVVDAAGLDPEAYGTQDFMLNRGLWDLMEIFSDGEVQLIDPADLSDPTRLLQFNVNRGEFYDKMARLHADSKYQSGPVVDEINKFARTCGWLFAKYVDQGKMEAPVSMTTRPMVSPIDGSAIVQFDQYVWKGSSEARSIILEYGPGITGRKFIDAQLKAFDQGIVPFQYIGISDGPFVNQFLNTYLGNNLEKRLNDTPSDRAALREIVDRNTLLAGREDGMLQATESLLATPQPSGASEIYDLILLTGVHEADPRELETTIKLSPQLLMPDGKLLLSAPIDKANDVSVPFHEQLRWAEQAGYVAEWQNMIPTGDTRLGKATVSGLAALHK